MGEVGRVIKDYCREEEQQQQVHLALQRYADQDCWMDKDDKLKSHEQKC